MQLQIVMPPQTPFSKLKKALAIGIGTLVIMLWFKDLLFKVTTFFALIFIAWAVYKFWRWGK